MAAFFYPVYLARLYIQTGNKLGTKMIAWLYLTPLVPLEQSVTPNQYKVILIDYRYDIIQHFYPDGHFKDKSTTTYKPWRLTE